jgi:regulatory protein SWI6
LACLLFLLQRFASTKCLIFLKAIYSSVPVYEMEVNRIAVMRRRSDSWLNATQILKVAGIEKGKRTKVLEKEILPGQHEKVQGGYGKYQGTWISYERGVEFCRQYGVEELLRPLLEHDMGQDGMTTAGSGGVETPTKEQAMAAQRKRLYGAGTDNPRPNGPSPNGTFFKNISSTASNAVAAISKARFDSPAPRPVGRQNSSRKKSFPNSQESSFPGGSQQSMQSLASENSFSNAPDSAYGTQNGVYYNQSQVNGDANEPPRKKLRPSSSQDTSMRMNDSMYNASMRNATPLEANESFMYRQTDSFLQPEDTENLGLQPLRQPTSKSALEKQRLLTSLFLDPNQNDFSLHPALQRLSGEDLDTPLDQPAHTALHWAATLGRLSLAKALIARGANIFRVNAGGETALDKACSATNNHDQASFPEFLELLGPTIDVRDGRGRTVLHHISLTSAVKGRMTASIYYLESLLEYVVRQGSAPSSQQNSFISNSGLSTSKPIGLASFMHNIVNAQDKAGETALNIAARGQCRSIVQQLVEVRADPTIPNRVGLRPRDFGVGTDVDEVNPVTAVAPYADQAEDMAPARIVGESSRDIINCKCLSCFNLW